jgi:hypothetical protein
MCALAREPQIFMWLSDVCEVKIERIALWSIRSSRAEPRRRDRGAQTTGRLHPPFR